MDTPETIPTWGYKPDGSGQIFNLLTDEVLPEGWELSPSCIMDPDLATAEALSARAAGRAYVPPAALAASEPVSAPLAELEAAIAENERLTAIIARGTEENERLAAELEAADALHENGANVMDALQADLAAAQATVADLQAALSKAHEDGRVTVAERNEAKAAAEALAADLAKVKADLDEATKPKPATGAKGR